MKSMVKRIKWALQNPHTYNQKKVPKYILGPYLDLIISIEWRNTYPFGIY